MQCNVCAIHINICKRDNNNYSCKQNGPESQLKLAVYVQHTLDRFIQFYMKIWSAKLKQIHKYEHQLFSFEIMTGDVCTAVDSDHEPKRREKNRTDFKLNYKDPKYERNIPRHSLL